MPGEPELMDPTVPKMGMAVAMELALAVEWGTLEKIKLKYIFAIFG
jgi:hypothetical protein